VLDLGPKRRFLCFFGVFDPESVAFFAPNSDIGMELRNGGIVVDIHLQRV
jgi:hypothetical protein